MARTRVFGGLLVAGALYALAPTAAHAQLFPNMTIRRERVDLVEEAPVYKMFRQQYYGYYPTCWKPFPPGWGCPCPNSEFPDWQAALARQPLQPKPTAEELSEGESFPSLDDPAPGIDSPRRGDEPEAPPFRSPFETDPDAAGERPGDPAAPAGGTGGAAVPPTTLRPAPGIPIASTPRTFDSLPMSSERRSISGSAGFGGGDDPMVDLGPVSNAPPIAEAEGAFVEREAPRRRGLLSGLFSGRLLRR